MDNVIMEKAVEWNDRLFDIVVSTSDCRPRGPGFGSRSYPRNFSGSIGGLERGPLSLVRTIRLLFDVRNSEDRLRKVKLMLRDKRFDNHKAHCTPIWQQPLQSVSMDVVGVVATRILVEWNLWEGKMGEPRKNPSPALIRPSRILTKNRTRDLDHGRRGL